MEDKVVAVNTITGHIIHFDSKNDAVNELNENPTGRQYIVVPKEKFDEAESLPDLLEKVGLPAF